MRSSSWRVFAGLVCLLTRSAAAGAEHGAEVKPFLFGNLGPHHHAITTTVPEAQKFFDQGLILCFAFNHPEAIRSFEEAARLDPNCAMAYWGLAFAYGANINMPMPDEAVPKAAAAMKRALERAPKASPGEQAYIQALAKRYTDKPTKDRAPLDLAFAEAMRQVHRQYPEDLDAATFFAESLMDTMPWNYWNEDGTPKPATTEVLATLDSILKRKPDHPGACHFYIHAVEASPNPELGLPAAHRLRDLVPGSGHLVHMPSHIYLRLGMYHDATLCNERAVDVDEAYIARTRAKGTYPPMYYGHNVHFLSYALSMEGRSAEAIREAKKTSSMLTEEILEHMPPLRGAKSMAMVTLARFGHWDEALKQPAPALGAPLETATWRYVRGLAYVRKRQIADAERETAGLEKIAGDKIMDSLDTPALPAASLIRIARAVLQAELAGIKGNTEARLRGLTEAVAMQDKIPYMEPPYWYFPVRQLLGAANLEAGKVSEAKTIYEQDLRKHPQNGWSLFGMLQCHRRSGRSREAQETEAQFRDAWKYADVILTSSCF